MFEILINRNPSSEILHIKLRNYEIYELRVRSHDETSRTSYEISTKTLNEGFLFFYDAFDKKISAYIRQTRIRHSILFKKRYNVN